MTTIECYPSALMFFFFLNFLRRGKGRYTGEDCSVAYAENHPCVFYNLHRSAWQGRIYKNPQPAAHAK